MAHNTNDCAGTYQSAPVFDAVFYRDVHGNGNFVGTIHCPVCNRPFSGCGSVDRVPAHPAVSVPMVRP